MLTIFRPIIHPTAISLLAGAVALCAALVLCDCAKPFQKPDDFIGELTAISGEHIDYYMLCVDGVAVKPRKIEPGYEQGIWSLQDSGVVYRVERFCEPCSDAKCTKGKPVCTESQDSSFVLVESAVFPQWRKDGPEKPAGPRPDMVHGEGTMYTFEKRDPAKMPKQCARTFQPTSAEDLEFSGY